MPKKGSTAVKVTFMTMTLVTPVTAVKFDYGAVLYRGKVGSKFAGRSVFAAKVEVVGRYRLDY